MRNMVKADTAETYDRVVRLLEARRVPMFTRSPKRLYVSTGALSDSVRSEVEACGGSVLSEAQYLTSG